MGLES